MGSSPSSLYPKPVSTNPEGPKTLPPLRQKKIYDLMRTVSQLEAESPRGPDGVNRFVEWRIQVTEAKIELNQHSMKDLNESSEEGRVSNHDEYHHTMADLQEKRDVLDREWVQLLTQGQFLREDLQDMVVAKDTDIQQLYWHWSTPGDGGVADSRSKRRSKFDRAVKEYHGTERESGVAQPERWCPVLGVWLPKGHVKYTQIVPFTLQSNELSCMFGVRDAALNTARNGLPMKTNIEEAYDNGWVVILPDGSVQATPTQWKLVVINEDLFGKCVHRGGGTRPGGEWFWEVRNHHSYN